MKMKAVLPWWHLLIPINLNFNCISVVGQEPQYIKIKDVPKGGHLTRHSFYNKLGLQKALLKLRKWISSEKLLPPEFSGEPEAFITVQNW